MFLRPENETAEAKASNVAREERIAQLRGSIGESPSEANADRWMELAEILLWHGHYRETKDLLSPLAHGRFDPEITFKARQLVAGNHYRHDQYDLASRQYHTNIAYATDADRADWIAEAEDGIAWVLIDVGHYSTGEFEEAEKIFSKNMPFHREKRDWGKECMALYGLSRAYAGMGHYGRAIELAEESIEALKRNGGEYLLQLPILQLANIYRDRGKFDEALPIFEAAIAAADRSQDPYIQVLTGLGYGLCLKYLLRVDEAVEIWRLALACAKECDFPRLAHELCNRLAIVMAENGEYQEAYQYQLACQKQGNRVGVMASALHNQQMLLREQMHQSAQLETNLTSLRAGIEASLDGIFVLDINPDSFERDDPYVKFANAAAAGMLGHSAEEINHVLIRAYWKTDSADELIAESLTVFDSGEPRTLDPIQLEFPERVSGWYSVKIAKVPTGVVWTISDVTERHAMQREIVAQRDRLKETNARLVALDRDKSDMLGVAAHDLRSPIGNIRSLCELISMGGPESADLIHTIEDIADSLLHLIKNILDVEKIERGEVELALTKLELASMVGHVAENFMAEAAQKKIDLHMELPDRPMYALADESAVARILQNLISNAIKFSPPGCPVAVRAHEIGSKVRIEIEDHGAGITDGDRQKLFGKFARLSARPTGGESSTGLGLSIVKRLVDAQNGSVGCDSVPGQGATFWVEFPAPAAPVEVAA